MKTQKTAIRSETPRSETKGEATRRAILTAAARIIRERGPDRIGVAEVMREAGLTHGGFYAHFTSRDALVAEAIRSMFEGGRQKFVARVGGRTGPEALKTWIDSYVSREHRDNPGGGCAMAALISDIARLEPVARAAFDDGIRGIAGRLSAHLPAGTEEHAVSSLMAEMAGAVALARAVSDPPLSDRILKTSRAALKARIDTMVQA
ncbi:TetR/AcrR family transcriptional regulator [Ferrovibrio terrae]|nr:TetR/AcrR family transcriptional regulator [Ferrovibrio terrae]